MKKMWLGLILSLVLCVPAFGAGAKAVVTGPKEVALGDLVVLDASRSEALCYEWVLTNSDKSFLVVENGQKLVFASGTPGKYIFVVVVGNEDNNKKLAVASAKHEIMIGTVIPEPKPDNPTPKPDNPTPPVVVTLPDGNFQISQSAYEWAKATNDKATALKLATNFTSLAAQAAAGTIDDAEAMVKATSSTNKATVGENTPQYTIWKAKFFTPLNVKLNELSNDKLQSIEDHVGCWNEIALGLKTYGESK